jgi:hypothetical protein
MTDTTLQPPAGRLRRALAARSGNDLVVLGVCALAWGTVVALFAARAWGRAVDDFFITYRYAAHIAQGRGFVFNPGEQVFGTTAPGFAVLLAALHAITRISIPGLGTLTTAFALWLLALLALDELALRGRRVEGVVAGTLVVVCTYVWPQHGSEIPVALLLLVAAARSAEAAPILAAAAAALAAWCRPESALGAGLLVLLEIARRRRFPGRYVVAFSLFGLAAAAIDRLALGSILPVTLAAKRAQAAWQPELFVSGPAFWSHSLQRVEERGYGTATSLILALGLAGAPLLWRRGGRGARMLLLYSAALAVAYPLLGVAEYPWYAIPLVLTWTVSAVVAAGELVRLFARRAAAEMPLGAGPGRRALALVAPGFCALALALPVLQTLPHRVLTLYERLLSNGRYELYRQTGEWLAANTPPGATIAYVEVGTIGYYSDRSVQDMLGLVTPRAIPYVAEGDMVGAFLTAPTDYFLYDKNLFGFVDPIKNEPWFEACYDRVVHFDAPPPADERVVVWARQPGAVLPPPRGPESPPKSPPPDAAPKHRRARPS